MVGGHPLDLVVPSMIFGTLGMTLSGLLATYGSIVLRFSVVCISSISIKVETNLKYARIASIGRC